MKGVVFFWFFDGLYMFFLVSVFVSTSFDFVLRFLHSFSTYGFYMFLPP